MRYLEHAIDRAAKVCGTKCAVAERLGVTPQRLNDYQSGLRHMPHDQVLALALLAGMHGGNLWAAYSADWHENRKTPRGSALASVRKFLGIRTRRPAKPA